MIDYIRPHFLSPYTENAMPLTPICDRIWEATHDLSIGAGITFPCRMTILHLHTDEVMLHSPIPIDDALADAIARIGPVRHIVAPNNFHHLHLSGAINRYPNATTWAAPGLETKRDDLHFDHLLTETHHTWPDECNTLLIKGSPSFNEVVLLHHPTATLIVCDLLFHIHHPATSTTSQVLRCAGTYKRFAQSRLWRLVTRDADATADCLAQLSAWDFHRVIMAHGQPIEGADAKQRTLHALHYLPDVHLLEIAAG